MSEVYSVIGCSKQNVSYWALHAYSTQAKKSVYEVIRKSAEIFGLDDKASETLANSAGLSLEYKGGDIINALGYEGRKKQLCDRAIISERMLRLYKTKTPTKQTITALAVALDKSCAETDSILHRYGYCLSDSIIGDVVVKWYLTEYISDDKEILIFQINDTLSKMGVPLC